MGNYKWGFIEKIGQYSVQFIISIILTRLLEPQDFGTIAILNVVLVLANLIVDGGFTQGLIRKSTCRDEDYNSIFWLNLGMSVIIYVILYYCSPLILFLFQNSELVKLSRVIFLVIPIGAFSIIQLTILVKELNFKAIALIVIFSALFSGTCGIFFALKGFGVWSLVYQVLLNSLLLALFTWIGSSWRPTLKFDINPIKEILPFSFRIFASSFINNVFNNLYTIIIGKFYSQSLLGVYSQANRYGTQPGILVDAILTRVTFPLFSKYQHKKYFLRKYYRELQINVTILHFPLMLSLILVSEDLIPLILGDRWSIIIPYFIIFCIISLTYPYHPLSLSILKVQGLSNIIFKLEVLKKILMIVILLFTIKRGMYVLIIGQLIFFLSVLPINMYFSGKELDYKLLRQFKDLIPYVLIVIFSFFSVNLIFEFIFLDNILFLLILKLIIFFTMYVGLLYLLKPQKILYFYKYLKNGN